MFLIGLENGEFALERSSSLGGGILPEVDEKIKPLFRRIATNIDFVAFFSKIEPFFGVVTEVKRRNWDAADEVVERAMERGLGDE